MKNENNCRSSGWKKGRQEDVKTYRQKYIQKKLDMQKARQTTNMKGQTENKVQAESDHRKERKVG